MISNILLKLIRKFDDIFPETIVFLRIKLFRLFVYVFSKKTVSYEGLIALESDNHHIFFGYYDITPFNQDDKKILALRAPLINRHPSVEDYVEVGFFNINAPQEFNSLGKTNTWCWQQGCRLQWYSRGENQVIYNCLIDGTYGAVIRDILTGRIIKEIRRSLYSVSQDGNWGLSLNFSRLQRLRPGYGYEVLPDETINNRLPHDSGIELINIKTEKIEPLFSLKDISKIEPHPSMAGAEHYFNHIMFNPSGKRFLFLHLWQRGRRRYSRLFTADRNGSRLSLLNNSGSVSHYNWASENEIVLYSQIKNRGYSYAIFNDSSGSIKFFNKNVPKTDGHPILLNNSDILITDTYPDMCHYRNLVLYKIKEDKVIILKRFDSPIDFNHEFRCDLHPRISNDRKIVAVDRIINKRRCITLIPLNYK